MKNPFKWSTFLSFDLLGCVRVVHYSPLQPLLLRSCGRGLRQEVLKQAPSLPMSARSPGVYGRKY